MTYRGDIALGSTIDIKFTTRRFSTGAPFTLAGSPVISAYVDNGTTEITAGITLTVDFDSRTGLHNVRVVATSGNGFAAGTNVQLVITTGTVDSVSVVGEVIASFSIESRSGLRPTTAGRTLDVSAGGEAGVDWANVGSPTTTLGLSGTTIKDVTDVTAALVTIAAYIDTEVAAIKAKTDNLPSDPADASDIAALLATIASYIDTEVAAIKAKTDLIPASPAAVGSAMTLTSAYDFAKGTVAMTEAYAADGAAYTPAQAFFMLVQLMVERSISGTTLTIKKLDKSTTAMTATLDNGTSPTSQTRAT